MITWHDLAEILPFIKALMLFIGGYLLATFLSNVSSKYLERFATPQHSMLLQKSIFFVVLIIFVAAALQQLDFNLTVLLGSAGIATAAIGFASKTSVSNMISGLFLIIEKSFEVGDTIDVKGTQGKVISIDLLSVKLLTADNTLVRVPNETIISTELTNYTHFAQRRCDIVVSVSYDTDIAHVQRVLLDVANELPLALKKPTPIVVLNDFRDATINLRLSIWVNKGKYDEAKDQLQQAILTALERAKISLPIPHYFLKQPKADSTQKTESPLVDNN
ncbi:MAG: mechanosensitive ion channel family protein [Pseudomonadota bacterium]|nr:mechanosensitive ion channel family protein [Pseudomonadota bacterium]